MQFDQFVSWAFQGVISGAVIYGVAEMKGLRTSIESLNAKLERIIEKTDWHGKELDKHDERLRRLEIEKE
jgi:hypothetical protein